MVAVLSPLLKKLQRHVALSDDECAAILELPRRRAKIKRGEILVHEDDEAMACCALLEGFICRQKPTVGGAVQFLSVQMAGDLVDLQNSLLDVADHNVQALTPATVAWIPAAKILALGNAHPSIGRALWIDTLIEASIYREWILNVGQRTAHERVAHLLCEIALRQRAINPSSRHEYKLPLNQGQIGCATGMSIVHVNRVLQQLRADGLIRLAAEKLSILDWPRLKVTAGFDTTYLHLRDGAALERLMASSR